MNEFLPWVQVALSSGLVFGIVKVFGKILIESGKIVQRLSEQDKTTEEIKDRLDRIESVLMRSSDK